MTDITILPDNNGKLAIYTWDNIYGLYCYLEIIRAPTNLTSLGQISHNFDPGSSTKNDTANLKPIIEALCVH